MNPRSLWRTLVLSLAIATFAVLPATAQTTTGTLGGTVTATDGSALPGVTVEAVHVPTGTQYQAVSGSNGRFTIPNVRVGGPYRVTATLEGFRSFEATNVTVGLGTTSEVPVTLALEALSEAITVTAEVDQIINPNRTGSSSSVSEEQIESLPTVNRTIQDFARTNPYVNVDAGDPSATRMTIAGKSNRYNNIQIDGAVNNDLFGLADTGTPGGQADAPPISLDALQEIQLVISPYDVRHGGFTGGGVNAITRSGANALSGSLFYSKRDDSFVGDGPFDTPITNFDANQYGGRVGGPILRDRLFFFLNGEVNSREEPTGVSAELGSTTLRADIAALAAQAKEIALRRYGHETGTLGEFPQTKESDNFFGRLDWNIGNTQQFTLRHNYVDAQRDVVSDRFFTRFRFPTSTYVFADKTNSTVAQLNSALGAALFNEGRISYTTIRDQRASRSEFPAVEIGGAPRSAQVILGSEQFSQANALDQDILEITDDLTWARGNHTLTLGTHNEFFEFKNLFLAPAYGYYFFPTIADFEAGTPTRYEVTFATGDDPRRPTQFDVAQYGLYINDQFHVSQNFTLTLGLRGDMPTFGKTPSFNPIVDEAIGYSTAETASESVLLSPRLGFNWQLGGSQLRGGVGIFAGRAPYVWISNAYANTGVEQITLVCNAPSCTTTFEPDPFNQPRDFPAGTGAFRVNLIDPDFQLPHVLRSTLGFDQTLFFGVRGTAEVIWTKNMEDVYYTDVNSVQTGTSPLDGRPTYSRVSSRLTQAVLITNTDEGEQTVASLQLNKRLGRNLTLSTSYAYQDANSAFDGSSSQAHSNFQFHHTRGDIFTPEVSRSAFETEHRFNAAASWNAKTGFLDHTVGFYYNAQSGRPYSLLFGTDINKDGFSTNDLLYLPSADGVIIQKHANSTWQGDPYQQWLNFLDSAGVEDATGGRIMNRYELNEPWSRQLDFHYELGLPIRRSATAVTFDVTNLLNMFDSDAGVVRYVAFQNYLPVTYAGQDAETGKPIYKERFANDLEENGHLSTADLRSRWQARLGLRVSF